MAKHLKKENEAANELIGQGQAKDMSEIGETAPIERVAENDFVEAAELEAFMNEILTIQVHPTQEEGSLDVITPNVNGVNQPIIRGVESKVKRKYVEDLARTRTTVQDQQEQTPGNTANILIPRTSLTYPFAVLHDPSPVGREWLQSILAEA